VEDYQIVFESAVATREEIIIILKLVFLLCQTDSKNIAKKIGED
jgi:hypothetical protein